MEAYDRIVCVVGPTASGKTKMAVELAKQLGGEVISCDSMQIYRGMTSARQSRPPGKCRKSRTT